MPEVVTELCSCNSFVFWYRMDDGTSICECGHAHVEHLKESGRCIGELSRLKSFEPDPMPVFVIKAKDKLADATLVAYRRRCYRYGLDEQADEVTKAIQEFNDWQGRNPTKLQLPDHKHVPVRSEHEPLPSRQPVRTPTAAPDSPASPDQPWAPPTADAANVRRMGGDGVADRVGLEPVRAEGNDHDSLVLLALHLRAEADRLLRLLGVEDAVQVDSDHATSSTDARPRP